MLSENFDPGVNLTLLTTHDIIDLGGTQTLTPTPQVYRFLPYAESQRFCC